VTRSRSNSRELDDYERPEAFQDEAIEAYQEALKILTAEAFPHHHEITVRNLERALAVQRSSS
jgi:hypothetical protein